MKAAVTPAPMIVRATTVILLALGVLGIGFGALRVFFETGGRGTDGIVWVVWGLAHLLAARGIVVGSSWAFWLAALLGTLTLIASAFLIFFIVSLSQEVEGGIDWLMLAPYGLLMAAAVAMLLTAGWGLRRPATP